MFTLKSRITWTIFLSLMIVTNTLAAVIPPPTAGFKNARVRVTDSVGSFSLNDTDGDFQNGSVSIAPDVAVGFNITPVDPSKPIIKDEAASNASVHAKLTNVTITATADNVSGSITIEGDFTYDGPPFPFVVLGTKLDGTSAYPTGHFNRWVDFDLTISFDDETVTESTQSENLPDYPFHIPRITSVFLLEENDIPITKTVSVELGFTFNKAGDSFTLPDSLEISFTVPTPSSAMICLPILALSALRRQRKQQ